MVITNNVIDVVDKEVRLYFYVNRMGGGVIPASSSKCSEGNTLTAYALSSLLIRKCYLYVDNSMRVIHAYTTMKPYLKEKRHISCDIRH